MRTHQIKKLCPNCWRNCAISQQAGQFYFMKRTTFYFSHDYNANNDVKILFMRQQLGMEGYGIYWFVIESLASAGGTLPLKIIPVLAMQMQATDVKVRAVVEAFDLFVIEGDAFFSLRLNEHIATRNNLIESGKKSAQKRWGNNEPIGLPINQPINEPIGQPNAKERKGKEIKGKERKLNETQITACIEYVGIFQKKKITSETVLKLWEIFQLKEVTAGKYYKDDDDIYRHFFNTLKYEKFTDIAPLIKPNDKKANDILNLTD